MLVLCATLVRMATLAQQYVPFKRKRKHTKEESLQKASKQKQQKAEAATQSYEPVLADDLKDQLYVM